MIEDRHGQWLRIAVLACAVAVGVCVVPSVVACDSSPEDDAPQAVPASQEDESHTGDETPTVYHCPFHPEVQKERRGTCPVCAMELVEMRQEPGHEEWELTSEDEEAIVAQIDEALELAEETGQSVYICTSDWDVVETEPGPCPKCEMPMLDVEEIVEGAR